MRNICLQRCRNNRICEKLAYFLRKIQILRVTNSIIFTIKNAIFSGYYFYMNQNIWGDFQSCISVRLIEYIVSDDAYQCFNTQFFIWILTNLSLLLKVNMWCFSRFGTISINKKKKKKHRAECYLPSLQLTKSNASDGCFSLFWNCRNGTKLRKGSSISEE